MGLAESKVILQKLSDAWQEAERQGSTHIDEVLQDSHFIRCLEACWTQLPENTQRRITGKSNKALETSARIPENTQLRINGTSNVALETSPWIPENTRLRIDGISNGALETSSKPRRKRKTIIKPKIALPESIENNLSSWVVNPLGFFCDADDHNIKPNISSFYRTLLHLEQRRDNDLIRSRFLKVILHKLRQSLGMQRLHSHSVDTIAQIISTAGLVKDSLEEIKTHINNWLKEGKKIDSLCQELHRNSELGHQYLCMLFYLPNDVTKEYLRVLHQEGPERMKAIKELKERGILEVGHMETLERLADALYTYLWGCIGPLSAESDHTPVPATNFDEIGFQLLRSEEATTHAARVLENASASPMDQSTESFIQPSTAQSQASIDNLTTTTTSETQRAYDCMSCPDDSTAFLPVRDPEQPNFYDHSSYSSHTYPDDSMASVPMRDSEQPNVYDHWLYSSHTYPDDSMASVPMRDSEQPNFYDHWLYSSHTYPDDSMASVPMRDSEQPNFYDHWLYSSHTYPDDSMASVPMRDSEEQNFYDYSSFSSHRYPEDSMAFLPMRDSEQPNFYDHSSYSSHRSYPEDSMASHSMENSELQDDTHPMSQHNTNLFETSYHAAGSSHYDPGSASVGSGSPRRFLDSQGQNLHGHIPVQAIGSA